MKSSPVVGIDVGGDRKGFHAVLLNCGRVLDVRRGVFALAVVLLAAAATAET